MGEAEPRRVWVAGSRDLEDPVPVYRDLDAILAEYGAVIVYHGKARGADSIADRWGWERRRQGCDVQVRGFEAKWQDPCVHEGPVACPAPPKPSHRKRYSKGQGTYCPFAGLRRNQLIADEEPRVDELRAYPLPGAGNTGTQDAIRCARRAHIPVNGELTLFA